MDKKCVLFLLSKELGIAQQATAVDWAYFHRDVVFDWKIILYEKIGSDCLLKCDIIFYLNKILI